MYGKCMENLTKGTVLHKCMEKLTKGMESFQNCAFFQKFTKIHNPEKCTIPE